MSALALLVGITFAAAVWGGIVLRMLWAWFIVPTFGLPSLSIPVAIGIGLMMTFLTYKYFPKEEGKDIYISVVSEFLVPFLALVLGWMVHLFM